ncbi:MAG: head-tail connector protein [Clostridiaceae bacterium]
MVLTLEEAKLYLRVDGAEEDALITKFIMVAEDICEGILRFTLTDFTIIPEAVKQSIFYAVACLYEQRENLDIRSMIEVMTRLLFAYRQESW